MDLLKMAGGRVHGFRGHRRRALRPVVLLLPLLLCPSSSHAQFSPGDLSRAHADLEGTANCSRCHEVGREISGGKCLICHAEIAAALRVPGGFHGTAAKSGTCVKCHKEHLGRDAPTSTMPRTSFDHAATGFPLEGRHAGARCDACHALKNIRDENIRTLVRRTGRTSVLGLRSDCASCHADPHGGTLGTACGSCHGPSSWAPAPKFDHAGTRFPLTGLHQPVACVRCHAEPVSNTGRRLFTSRAFNDCTPCHDSPHRGGATKGACSSCHTSEGWRLITGGAFDHNRTGFPLKDRHLGLRCEQCHGAQARPAGTRRKSRPGSRCADCHPDRHGGAFAGRFGGDCSACHTARGFIPSAFGLTDHAGTRFPLTGAHVATPCVRCHARAAGAASFRFASLACATCHKDPHRGQFTGAGLRDGCGGCHSTETWTGAAFDHAAVGFPLMGRHARIACTQCHRPSTASGGSVLYRGTPKDCQACHEDVHAAQFRIAGGTLCGSCHTSEDWKLLVFNHADVATFPLTGGHAGLACNSCHRPESIGGRAVVRFKPLPTRCESCHQGRIPADG